MRVTMVLRCLAMMRGGGENQHLAWIHELADAGVDIEVIAGRPLVGRMRHPIENLPARVTILKSPYARDFVYRWQRRRGFGRLTMAALHVDEEWFCRAAWRHIARGAARPDLVHAHALPQMARLRIGTLPTLVFLPGAPHPRYYNDLQGADAVLADGWAAAQMPSTLGRPVDAVPEAVDVDVFHPGGDSRRIDLGLDGKRVVLSVGRLVPIKNVQLLIAAMRHVIDVVPDAHLVIVGDGSERSSLEQQVASLGLRKVVTFAGYVPQVLAAQFYRSADLFALTSTFDNAPNAVLEAMASGLPIVATDVGGVRGILGGDEGGALVPSSDARAVAEAIQRLLSNDDRRGAVGARNRRRAVDAFSPQASARRLLEIYTRVATAASPRARRAS